VTPEQLLFFALFVVVALANLIARWLKARMQRRQAAETEQPRPVREIPRRLPPRVVITAPEAWRPPTTAPTAITTPPLARPVRRPPRLRLGGPPDLRRAIMLMTVLGPCRGREGESGGPTDAIGPR